MASHVIITDSTARRHTIKATPTKHLSDVLHEVCSKLSLNPDQYTLKHNNKPLDLSRSIRLSGLSSGAKLDLVQSSRSPAVVSVALQLPTTGGDIGTLSRLTDKFPSNTPIWQILRRFEAGAAGSGTTNANHNFTQRAAAQINAGTSGSGRLFYEMPVIGIMGRELASFVDLQKTLGQLGFQSGSCLLRLSFKKTEQPLEEAMMEITQYFKAIEEPPTVQSTATKGTHGGAVGTLQSEGAPQGTADIANVAGEPVPTSPPDTPMPDALIDAPTSEAVDPAISSSQTQNTLPQPTTSQPDLIIYAPPTTSTPQAAASTSYNEADYIPTVDHAQQHQALLNKESRNRKLLSDSELEAQASARAASLAAISSVTVRIRFPDQSQAQREYGRDATVRDVYDSCREMMHRPGGESFFLKIGAPSAATATTTTVPSGVRGPGGLIELKESNQRLITDLGWQGRVLVTVLWGDDASAEVRKGPSLKEEFRAKAENLKVELLKDETQDVSAAAKGSAQQATSAAEQGKGSGSGGGKEAKMMKFLKGLSKK